MLDSTTRRIGDKKVWLGRALSALMAVFLAVDGATKIARPDAVVDSFAKLGYHGHDAIGIGLLLLACTALYVIPRTSILGAILLTGYLGGATASQARIHEDVFPLIFPGLVGAAAWGGLYLRDARVRALIPLFTASSGAS